MTLDSQGDGAKPNAPPRSFFKKPKWALAATESSTRTDFYRRADQTYVDILAEKPRQRERRRDKPRKVVEEEKEEEDDGGETESRGAKRRRVSKSEADESGPAGSFCSSTQENPISLDSTEESEVDKPQTKKEHPRPTSRPSSRHSPGLTREKTTTPLTTHTPPKSSTVIDLEDEVPEPRKSLDPGPPTEDPISEPDDNEEFPELARKARERAKASETERQISARLRDKNSIPPGPDNSRGAAATRSPSVIPTGTGAVEVPRKEPIAKILITSALPNTKPLIVQRKLSQRLRDVREVWCKQQGFSKEMTARVFLTWRGTRLFDVTTCKGLGVQDMQERDPMFMDDILNDDETINIHMEAATEEILEAQRRQPTMAEPMDPIEDDPVDEVEEVQPQGLRLTLKSPGLEEFKLLAKPTSRISKIIKSFRKARGIPPDKEVNLFFDGERLNPDTFVQDNDIDDLDSIDAQVK